MEIYNEILGKNKDMKKKFKSYLYLSNVIKSLSTQQISIIPCLSIRLDRYDVTVWINKFDIELACSS